MGADVTGLGKLVRAALAEDVGPGDVTTAATVSGDIGGRARIVAKQSGIVSGIDAMTETYDQVDPELTVAIEIPDGHPVEPGSRVATIEGAFSSLLIAERTALNFLQRLSGVATLTRAFVDRIAETGVTIVDTRKTTPGWRQLEKQAVVDGGGGNHRMGLHDAYLIKENHITAAGGIEAALSRVAVANDAGLPVEIEVRSVDEIDIVLASPHIPDRIMCDNFALDDLITAVRRSRDIDPHIVIEASGGVTLDSVAEIAATGVDWISAGALTHSAPALDLSCLIDRV